MKYRLFTLQLLLFAFVGMASAQFPDPFLSDDTRPDATQWLPDPPSLTGGDFANDFYYYQWGKTQREGESGERALSDESTPLYKVFSEAMGIELSYDKTPEIIFLAESATSDAYRSNKTVKNLYQRRRPFATFNEPSLKPEEDEAEASSYSYPSTHATNGWMFALTLCTIAPERTEEIMNRAREYALNRVICGHHWKSDIDASLMLASGLFTNVVVTEAYQQQLIRSRNEYVTLTGESTGISATPNVDVNHSSPVYNIQGQQVSPRSNIRQVYIRDGVKFINH